jgi:hypothetical protein
MTEYPYPRGVYYVGRRRWGWAVWATGSDGLERPVCGPFFRRITAERVAADLIRETRNAVDADRRGPAPLQCSRCGATRETFGLHEACPEGVYFVYCPNDLEVSPVPQGDRSEAEGVLGAQAEGRSPGMNK